MAGLSSPAKLRASMDSDGNSSVEMDTEQDEKEVNLKFDMLEHMDLTTDEKHKLELITKF